ncbi:13E12 repeat family protein [Gordonia sp. HY285]|uniref:DUF222 domain-containing protein n=1 Tax=Gordonia liuliyuniae TaxID=2911517 RepID=UPI001F3E0BDA|nr:DUF222 domain-containing protein [Gordonia liuliyuniae]MCF8611088.1 13E12 repeat family protein [Gordonia liuliyuniae]
MNATLIAPSASSGRFGSSGSYRVDGDDLAVELRLPTDGGGDLIAFAGEVAACEGTLTWYRYRALHAAYEGRLADPAYSEDSEYDRVCNPFTQVAAAYAVVAHVGRRAAEGFLDRALACFDRIPAIGRVMRDGLMSPYAFAQAVLETANVVDEELLAAIDADAALRLREIGGLSVPRVAKTVRAVVVAFDPDAAHEARESTKAGKQVIVAPLDADLSQMIVTTSAEDAALSFESINAIIAGVCEHDPRSVAHRRSDAALARINGMAFTCACERADCMAELSDHAVAERCTNVVLHVVCRKEVLDGSDDSPAYLDGFGPISAEHARDIAGRADAVRRDVDLDDVAAHPHQAADPYRPDDRVRRGDPRRVRSMLVAGMRPTRVEIRSRPRVRVQPRRPRRRRGHLPVQSQSQVPVPSPAQDIR